MARRSRKHRNFVEVVCIVIEEAVERAVAALFRALGH
jgi:hypothetical protein